MRPSKNYRQQTTEALQRNSRSSGKPSVRTIEKGLIESLRLILELERLQQAALAAEMDRSPSGMPSRTAIQQAVRDGVAVSSMKLRIVHNLLNFQSLGGLSIYLYGRRGLSLSSKPCTETTLPQTERAEKCQAPLGPREQARWERLKSLVDGAQDRFREQGTVVATWRTVEDATRGPYYRLMWREDGRQRNFYLGASEGLAGRARQLLAELRQDRMQHKFYETQIAAVKQAIRRQNGRWAEMLPKLGLYARGCSIRGWRSRASKFNPRAMELRVRFGTMPKISGRAFAAAKKARGAANPVRASGASALVLPNRGAEEKCKVAFCSAKAAFSSATFAGAKGDYGTKQLPSRGRVRFLAVRALRPQRAFWATSPPGREAVLSLSGNAA